MDEQNLDKTTQTTSRILLKSIAARNLLVVGDAALTSGTIHVQADELVVSEKYIDTITITMTTQRYTFILQTNESSSVSETSCNYSSNTSERTTQESLSQSESNSAGTSAATSASEGVTNSQLESTVANENNVAFQGAKERLQTLVNESSIFMQSKELLSSIQNHSQNRLVILILGPTAKLLVEDLSELGIRAIDLEHIDSEYGWFKRGDTSKVKLNHEHTAEHKFDENIELVDGEIYVNQIIDRVD